MTNDRRSMFWGNALLWAAGVLAVLSMPCILFGLLGLLGIAADVSTPENRQIGLGSLRLAASPWA